MGYFNANSMVDYKPAELRFNATNRFGVTRIGEHHADHRGDWRPQKTRREDRPTTCTHEGCTTRLSKYNLHTDKCGLHEHAADSLPVRSR